MAEKITYNIIKKAIIPTAGMGTRFLSLSKILPKELLPLIDKPMIQYAIEEIRASGVDQDIIFVTRPKRKNVLEYFKRSLELEKILKERGQEDLLTELKKLNEISENISFLSVSQKHPLGDGHAISQAGNLIGKEPAAVLFPDDIIDSRVPCVAQLVKVFKTCQKPVIALKKMTKEKISRYGVVKVEKIANRLYKIKKIIEKPSFEEAPSNLAIVGRYIITSEVFDCLKKMRPNKRGEIILAEALNKMIEDNKAVYGYEFEGHWLECGDKINWLKSNFYLSLKHPKFGPELREYLKEIM